MLPTVILGRPGPAYQNLPAASDRKSVPKDDIASAVSNISRAAHLRGLSSDVLDVLIDLLTKAPCHLDQTTSSHIIKALIPRRKVSEQNVHQIVGCLGLGSQKPSLGTQVRPGAGLLAFVTEVS